MKYPLLFVFKNKTAQALILVSALIVGLPGLAGAHEDTPDQDAAVQRPVPPDRATGNQNASTRREDAIRSQNQGANADRDGRPLDRPNQDWGADRDGHGGGH